MGLSITTFSYADDVFITCDIYFHTPSGNQTKLSLISTHAFRLSPAKFFAWDMRSRVVKRMEQDEKYLSLCSHLKFKYFNFCEIFLQRNQSEFFLESRGHFTRIEKFSQNGHPTALSGLRKYRPQYILKTRIIERQTSRLRQFFAGTLRKWRLIFLPRYFSLTKNSVSYRRKAWMEIRLYDLMRNIGLRVLSCPCLRRFWQIRFVLYCLLFIKSSTTDFKCFWPFNSK